jgi:hypothetical protein
MPSGLLVRRAAAAAHARRAAAAAVLAIAACSRRAPLASCGDDLHGVWRDTTGGASRDGAERWMLLDDGATLEAYLLFPDADGPGELVAAPRRIDLSRTAAGDAATSAAPGAAPLTGTVLRRYMRGAQRCDARVPVHVTRCTGDTLELVLADPAPPLELSPCRWPRPAPSRLVRWQRE